MEKIWNEMYEAAKAVLNERRISEYVTCGEVSAAVCSKSGTIYTGVCVDTCSTLGICAERNAIFTAVGHGYRKGDFSKIYIMFANGNYGTPCFACRQVIVEFFNEDDEVISVNGNGEEKVYKVRELCQFPVHR